MFKRIRIYLKEMYPFWSRLAVAFGLFFTIYFLVLATENVKDFSIGGQEFIAVLTIFTFLLSLRIADEFKDYDTDKKNFPDRPLPSGRVTKRDLIVLLLTFQIPTIILNVVFMNNIWWFLGLWGYGILMSFWFFAKKIIKPSLVLALITHNPVQFVQNLYIVSFICIKYGLNMFTLPIMLIALALYLPGLIYEIGRKIRAPKKETAYTTYSKLMGYKNATLFVTILVFVHTLISTYVLANISVVAIVALWILFISIAVRSLHFVENPNKKPYMNVVMTFLYGGQIILLAGSLWYVLAG